ncbi:GNAT family N-acetyltransferase [Variovorax sp. J22P168]|uniref:GNAT family N-acetyltransferase n=1 Tax=Variovorax jilinensis TaxID=3053513 RepID=UPI0025780E30|nr:GNAT family N-acetyltransferase [Variovorax sp. J22P168]MDM0015249.1 GNAT family N-acetyltransferase [Variovorax sp. J22P168]
MTKSREAEADLSIRQICGAWRLMCRDAPGRRVSDTAGVTYIFSGLPVAFFNLVVLTQPSISAAALRSFAEEARAWTENTTDPWSFLVTGEALESGVDAAAILGEFGLGPAFPLTGMVATEVAPLAAAPPGLRLTVPADDTACASIVDINSAAYDLNLGPANAMLGRQTFWNDQFPVLGTVDGTPASSSAVLVVDGCRYVALVATLPAYRRQGYAEAAMRQALENAAAAVGPRPSVLHATEAGRPIYERMGYSTITSHTLFMDAALLARH